MSLLNAAITHTRAPAPSPGFGDWLLSKDEYVKRAFDGTFFSAGKASEGGHYRRVLLLGDSQSLQPAINICPRSTRPWSSGIEHGPHNHHPTRRHKTGHDPVPSCKLEKNGWVTELFAADRDLLMGNPFEYSCHEPDDTQLIRDAWQRGWHDGT